MYSGQRRISLLPLSLRKKTMALQTRQNPETNELEVMVSGEWTPFEEYRKRQIDEAYQNSIKFLRDRLGEDEARKLEPQTTETDH
jgi:hypothetical protein